MPQEPEFEKRAVECHGDHANLEKEMEKRGSETAVCPYCGKTVKKPKAKETE